MKRIRSVNPAGSTLIELMVAVAILALLLGGLSVILFSAMQLLRDADAAGEAVRLAEAQIESLRALPPADRTQGRGLPPLTGAEALDRLPGGTCDVTVEPYREAGSTAGLLLVRVRVGWTGECGERNLELSTVVGPPRE